MYLIYENSIFANFNDRKAFIGENAKQSASNTFANSHGIDSYSKANFTK